METFIGDDSLSVYIARSLCANGVVDRQFQTGVVLVNRLILNSTTTTLKSNLLSKTLASNCDSVVINLSQQLTTKKLLEHCRSITFRRYNHLQMIFDLGRVGYSVFSQLIFSLSEVYQQCANCGPFILLFEDKNETSGSVTTFARWISGLLRNAPKLFQGFRAVISSSSTAEKSDILHLNPVLDGCLEYSGIFLPKSVADFRRLKAKRCNLHSSVLSVSISRVGKLLKQKL